MAIRIWILFVAFLLVVSNQAAVCRTSVEVNWQEGKLQIQTDEPEPGAIFAKTIRASDLNPRIAMRVWEKAQNLRIEPSKPLGALFVGYEDFCDRFRRSDIILYFVGTRNEIKHFDLRIFGAQGLLAMLNIPPDARLAHPRELLRAEAPMATESIWEQTPLSKIPALTGQEPQVVPLHVEPTLSQPVKHIEEKSEVRVLTQHTGIIVDCSQFLFPRVKYIRLINEHGMAFHDRTAVDLLIAQNLGMADYASSLQEALNNSRAGINPLIVAAVRVGVPRREDIVLNNKDAENLMQDAHLLDCLYQGSLVIVTGAEF